MCSWIEHLKTESPCDTNPAVHNAFYSRDGIFVLKCAGEASQLINVLPSSKVSRHLLNELVWWFWVGEFFCYRPHSG